MNTTKAVKSRFSEKKITTILQDYRLAWESREASLLGRKEVFMGKAKFGIFGDGSYFQAMSNALAKEDRK